MAVHTPLKSDHSVLGEDFCPGYSDPFGNWQTGFPCPQLDDETPGLCCGVDNLKYCCNGLGPKHIVNDVTHLPLVMGIVFGVSVAMIVSVVVCCFKCSCCLLYKKRQPANTGPLYHLHCPSSGSNGGVANMYSFSSEATPQDTPRSSSARSHCGGVNNRWSITTSESGPGNLNLDHHLALLEEASPTPTHAPFRLHNRNEDHHSNSSSGGRIPSSARLSRALPDITMGLSREDEELPPPYNSNHSTLIAVRTNHGPQHATSNEVINTSNSNNRISSIASATNNHQDSHSRVPPSSSLPSSTHSSNSLPQGFPTFLQHQNHQQRNISSGGSASLRPQFVENRHQRHSIASIGTEDNFINGFSAFPPPPSETTASTSISSCNIFSLPAPPPPSFTLQQSPDLHHNHNQQQQQYNSSNNNNNWPHRQHSSGLYNQRSTSSVSSNSSSRTFAPVLSPTRRPCSTAHIIQMHNPHLPPDQELRMYTATKF